MAKRRVNVKSVIRGMKRKGIRKILPTDRLSTGCTLLDLACSGKISGGFAKGFYYFLVGDSSSGKTFLIMTCIAEAIRNVNFKNYRFIFDDIEGGALMDVERFFGAEMAERLEAPRYEKGLPMYSETTEELYYNLDDAVKVGKPFIYLTDSMDALDAREDEDKFQEQKTAYRKGTKAKGTFGLAKPKANSMYLRRVLSKMRSTGSILIIVSQTRDNIQPFSRDKKTRSGGRALRFYATLEMWSSIKERLYKTVHGKKRQIGIICQVKVKKNRMQGKEWEVELPIYWQYGIDDIGACVNFLIDEKHWKVKDGKLKAAEFEFVGTPDKLIQHIEQEGLEKRLRNVTFQVWKEIEKECSLNRKPRYE